MEFFFDKEGESNGFNILQSREDIENSSIFKIEEKQISNMYGAVNSNEKRSLIIHEGVVIIAVVDDTIVITDSGRVKYLQKNTKEKKEDLVTQELIVGEKSLVLHESNRVILRANNGDFIMSVLVAGKIIKMKLLETKIVFIFRNCIKFIPIDRLDLLKNINKGK